MLVLTVLTTQPLFQVQSRPESDHDRIIICIKGVLSLVGSRVRIGG